MYDVKITTWAKPKRVLISYHNQMLYTSKRGLVAFLGILKALSLLPHSFGLEPD